MVEPLIYYMDTLGGNFIPNEFVDITASLQRKREAVSCHASQIDWLLEHDHVQHLLQATEIISSYRGMQSGCNAAEAFALCPVRKATTRRMLPLHGYLFIASAKHDDEPDPQQRHDL